MSWEESRQRIIEMFELQIEHCRARIAELEERAQDEGTIVDLKPHRRLLEELENRVIRIKSRSRPVMIQ